MNIILYFLYKKSNIKNRNNIEIEAIKICQNLKHSDKNHHRSGKSKKVRNRVKSLICLLYNYFVNYSYDML